MSESFTDKLQFNDFVRGRILQSTDDLTITPEELEYLEEIVKKDYFLKQMFKGEMPKFELISRNFSYDIYKYEIYGSAYCIKIGTEIDSHILQKESKILKKIDGQNFSPDLIRYRKGEFYSYLITDYLYGFNIHVYDSDHFNKNIPNLACHLANFHGENISKSNEKDKMLKDIFEMGDFPFILGEEKYKQILEDEQVKKLIETLENIKQWLTTQCDFKEKKSTICHMNLNKKNILFRGGEYRFCNFQNSYKVNPMWDIATLFINLNMTFSTQEEKFLDVYASQNNNCFDVSLDVLQAYKSSVFKLRFYKLICEFIYFNLGLDNIKHLDIFMEYHLLRPYLMDEFTAHMSFLDDIFYITEPR